MDPFGELVTERRLGYVETLYALHALIGEVLVVRVGGAGSQRPIVLRGKLEAGFELGSSPTDPVCFRLGELVLALSERSFVDSWVESDDLENLVSFELEFGGGLTVEFERAGA